MAKNRAFDESHYPEWRDPNELIPYEKNAKVHDAKQVKNIANSIKRFGWQQEAVITSDNVLVIGHGRRLAALKLGCKMPVKVIDKEAEELTDEDIRELRIADNKTNESEWDLALLTEDLDGLSLDGFDFEFGGPIPEPRNVEETEPVQNKVDTLPESKVYICAVSAFGTASECILEAVLDQETANKVLKAAAGDTGTQGITKQLQEALNGL